MEWILTVLTAGSASEVVARLGARDYPTREAATRECETMDPVRFAVVFATANRTGSPEARLRAGIVRDRRFPPDDELRCIHYIMSDDEAASEAAIAASLAASSSLRWGMIRVLRREFRRDGVGETVPDTESVWTLGLPWWSAYADDHTLSAALARLAVKLRAHRAGRPVGDPLWPERGDR